MTIKARRFIIKLVVIVITESQKGGQAMNGRYAAAMELVNHAIEKYCVAGPEAMEEITKIKEVADDLLEFWGVEMDKDQEHAYKAKWAIIKDMYTEDTMTADPGKITADEMAASQITVGLDLATGHAMSCPDCGIKTTSFINGRCHVCDDERRKADAYL